MELSNQEWLSYIEHSDVPQVVVEGTTDFKLLRLIERSIPGISILPVGGRSTVLFLAENQRSFSSPIAFLVDSDFWVFDGVPPRYVRMSRLIRTVGYSIENDLGMDVNVESLLLISEDVLYRNDIELLSTWFASCVSHRPQCGPVWRSRLKDVISGSPAKLSLEAAEHIIEYPPLPDVVSDVHINYATKLRGKTLLDVQRKYLCSHGRHIQHNPVNILELAWAKSDGYAHRILNEIRLALGTDNLDRPVSDI